MTCNTICFVNMYINICNVSNNIICNLIFNKMCSITYNEIYDLTFNIQYAYKYITGHVI